MAYTLPQTTLLETERLLLRELNAELWAYIFTNLSDPDIMNLYGLLNIRQLEAEKFKFFHGGITTYRSSFDQFLIINKATGKTVGRIGYHNWYFNMHRAEIGYVIEADINRNKGYMGEAMPRVIDYGFSHMKLNRIEAFISPHNTPSCKLVEKNGFTYEGLLKQHYHTGTDYVDSACYRLLKEEYHKG